MDRDSLPRSMQVNAALLPSYVGETVRLACQPTKIQGNRATVKTSDNAELEIPLSTGINMEMNGLFYEIIGTVSNANTLKPLRCVPLGNNIDMELVNDAIKLMHDERFLSTIFQHQEPQ